MKYDVMKKSVAQLTTPEILEDLMQKDDEKSNAMFERFKTLVKAVKSQNDSRYIIAYQLARIDECQDYKEYGYKSVADMSEKLFGYKKNTTSQLISTANTYLTCTSGQIESVFKSYISVSEDEYVASLEMNDVPITVLFEMMYSNTVMSHHGTEIIEFYKALLPTFSGVPSQKEMRDVKAGVKEIFACSKELTYDTYKAKAIEMKEEKDNKKDDNKGNNKDDNKGENQGTSETKASTVKKIQASLMNLQLYFEELKNDTNNANGTTSIAEINEMYKELEETYINIGEMVKNI
jgi:hypothetical protein